MSFTLAKFSEFAAAKTVGDPDCRIDRVDSLQHASAGAITFFANPRLKRQLQKTRASAVILQEEHLQDCPTHALVTDNPYLVFARIADLLNPPPAHEPGIHPTAVVSGTAKLDEGCAIGPCTVIDEDCVIGNNTYVGPNCSIQKACVIGDGCRILDRVTLCGKTVLGSRVTIHPGAVIGSDGFGLANEGTKWFKIPQLGGVQIGNDVEIGANTTIDRGTLGDTVLEDGVKLDNQIQVAHNVKIGSHTAIAACTGISGSAVIGKHCSIGGGVGIGGHIEIADHVKLGGMTRLTRSITEAGVYVSGTPALPYRKWLRNSALFSKLEELAGRIKKLEERGIQAGQDRNEHS